MCEQQPLPDIEPLLRVYNHAGPTWRHLAETAMTTLEHRGLPFTADDVRALIGDDAQPAHPNAWGALFNSHRRAGHIHAIDIYNSSHPRRNAGSQRLWQSTRTLTAGIILLIVNIPRETEVTGTIIFAVAPTTAVSTWTHKGQQQ